MVKKHRPEDYLKFFDNEIHTDRLKMFEAISYPMNNINQILSEKTKQKNIDQIQKYIALAEPAKDKLLIQIQSFFPDSIVLPDRTEDAILDLQTCIYFLSDYVRIILIKYMIDCYAHIDFHIHADEMMIAKVKQGKNYINAQVHKANDAYAYLKNAKKHSDAYFNNKHHKQYPKYNSSKYVEGKNVDYINKMPYSKITNEDVDNAYQILMKMVHWTVYADDARELIRNEELFSKKTSGGQDSNIETLFNGFMEKLYMPLYVASIPISSSADIIKVGFDYITKSFRDMYAESSNENAFVYEVSTINKKLKRVKKKFKQMGLEELIY